MKKDSGIEYLQKLRNPSKRPKKIDKIVRGVLFYWIIFVAIAWVTYWVKGSVPDTLVQYGLGGGAVELLITGVIEITRDRVSRKENEHEG